MNASMTKKRTNLLILLFSVMYFTSYISRINFGWNVTIWVWAALALFGGLLCALATRRRG